MGTEGQRFTHVAEVARGASRREGVRIQDSHNGLSVRQKPRDTGIEEAASDGGRGGLVPRRSASAIEGKRGSALAARISELSLGRSLGLAALRTAVELEVFDHLRDVPRSVGEVAREIGCQPAPLARVLRALFNQGLIRGGARKDSP